MQDGHNMLSEKRQVEELEVQYASTHIGFGKNNKFKTFLPLKSHLSKDN